MAELIASRRVLVSTYAPPGRWAEFGVERGVFSREMLKRSDVNELWLIDCWGPYPDADPRDPAALDAGIGESIYNGIVNTVGRDSRVRIVRELIETAAAGFPREFFDFVYLDAGHKYEHVKRHLGLLYGLVRKGGMLAGHDYWRAEGCPWIDVKRAVDDFCRKHGIAIAIITDEPCGSFAIIKAH